jgi:DNA invertase Pin-like site-specific DNA recombinase
MSAVLTNAEKAQGRRVGGPIPLGYRRVDKKLVIAPEEAETVRLIFRFSGYRRFCRIRSAA